ncbi:MAG: hypothetical protein ACRD2U_07905 [Terriglobales bacterium]
MAHSVLIGAAAAGMIAVSLPERFESTLRLMPVEFQAGLPASPFDRESKLLGMNGPEGLIMGLLRSRTVEDRLIARFNLKKVYRVQEDEKARKCLAENTVLTQGPRSGIITIAFTDKNAQRAAAVSNGYAGELNRLIGEFNMASAHDERLFLERRLQEVKPVLGAAEEDLSAFAGKNAIVDVPQQGASLINSEIALNGELAAGRADLESMKESYTNGNIRVREASARINELQVELGKMAAEPLVRPGKSPASRDWAYLSIRKLPWLAATYSDLFRRSGSLENEYDALTELHEMAKIREASQVPSIEILDSANVPERRSFPPRVEIVFLGALFGCGWEICWILCKAYWEDTDVADMPKWLIRAFFEKFKMPDGRALPRHT